MGASASTFSCYKFSSLGLIPSTCLFLDMFSVQCCQTSVLMKHSCLVPNLFPLPFQLVTPALEGEKPMLRAPAPHHEELRMESMPGAVLSKHFISTQKMLRVIS